MENSTNTVKEGVLKAIREHKVAMRPAALFKAEYILMAVLSVIVLAITVELAGFIFFGLRINGHEALLRFGPQGVGTFLIIFPWLLFIIDVVLLILLLSLIRHFAFGYRKPILLVLGVLFVAGGASAFILDRETPLHDRLMRDSDHGGLPAPFGGLYGHVRGPVPHEQGIYRGVVSEILPDRFRMTHDDLDADQDDTGYEVIPPASDPLTSFSVGENVYVYGNEAHGVIYAIGIQQLETVK